MTIKNNQAWNDYKTYNNLIKKIDIEVGEIIDRSSLELKYLDALIDELEVIEYLTDSEHFQKVKNKVKEVSNGCLMIMEKRKEKLEYEEKLRVYYDEVEKFFDNMISNYAENIELI